MLSITVLGDDQRAHLDAIDALWARYGVLLRARESVTGGMQWKTVAGREYLTRYRPDPETGKKVARSLGPRSAETERVFAEFMTKRDAIVSELRMLEPQVDTAGRIAKALRLGRLPSATAGLLRRLWTAAAFEGEVGLAVASEEALCAFERHAGILLPPRLIQNDGPIRLVMDMGAFSAGATDVLANLPWASPRSRADIDVLDDDRRVVAVDGQLVAEIFTTRALEDRLDEVRLDRDARGSAISAFSRRIPETVVIGRDASIVPVRALSPASYVVFHALVPPRNPATMHLAEERATAAAEAARRIPGQTIPSAVLEAAECLREDGSEGRPGSFGRIRI